MDCPKCGVLLLFFLNRLGGQPVGGPVGLVLLISVSFMADGRSGLLRSSRGFCRIAFVAVARAQDKKTLFQGKETIFVF